jgi:predicted dithiol-disulfide oxidoreductase (DUF899 family)
MPGGQMNDEIRALSRQIEALKQQLSEARRRSAPEPVADYQLTASSGEPIALSELFGEKDDLLVIHNMGRGCVYCTMWADGFASMLPHIESRTALVVVSPDEPAIQRAFAESRGWPFRMVSAASTLFSRDLQFADSEGSSLPGVSALHRNPDGTIVRTGSDEFGPGDDYSPPWRLFDLLQNGAGDWEPKYGY